MILNFCAVSPCLATEIWLQPWPPCEACGWSGERDIDQIFSSDQLWTREIDKLHAFVLTPFHLDRLTDRDLARVGDWLRRHHVDTDIDIEAMPFDPTCGRGIEGFGAPDVEVHIVQRLLDAHISPRYLTMDEPLWGGHYLGGTTACSYQISELASRVSRMLLIYKRAFPQIEIGDTEPYSALMSVVGWKKGLRQFISSVWIDSHVEIRFLNVDSGWNGSWQATLPRFVDELHRLGLQVGIIYDSTPKDESSLSSMKGIVGRYRELEDILHVRVDRAIFGGWFHYPDHLLPSDDPSALTNALKAYGLPRLSISTAVRQSNLRGTVTTDNGRPASHALVQLNEVLGMASECPARATTQGKVPEWASKALIGIRINNEMEPEDRAEVKLTVKDLLYTELDTVPLRVSLSAFVNLAGWQRWEVGSGALSVTTDNAASAIVIGASQFRGFSFNSSFFSVHPDKEFKVEIEESLGSPSFGSAFGLIVFFDRNLIRSERRQIFFHYVASPITDMHTDDHGRFLVPCSLVNTRCPVELIVAATETRRGTVLASPYRRCL